jgi:hypothetical protein
MDDGWFSAMSFPESAIAKRCCKQIANFVETVLSTITLIQSVVESGAIMATPLNINEALLQEALALDDQTTIDTLVETALREYIQRRKRLKVLDLFGTIDYHEDYDYKQQRQQT